jgi:hypothetical protein
MPNGSMPENQTGADRTLLFFGVFTVAAAVCLKLDD